MHSISFLPERTVSNFLYLTVQSGHQSYLRQFVEFLFCMLYGEYYYMQYLQIRNICQIETKNVTKILQALSLQRNSKIGIAC